MPFLILIFTLQLASAAPDWPRLLEALDSEVFIKRQEATDEIRNWALKNRDQALAEIPRQLTATEDPEIRLRLTGILRDIFVPKTRALFGFQYESIRTPSVKGNLKTVLKVEMVMRNTAAANGGLKRHDTIIALNGEPFSPELSDDGITRLFAKQIPGEAVIFHLLRDKKTIEIALSPMEHEITPEERKLHEERFKRWLEEKK
jgi:C-terminal processing protease CtpA/Prc